MKKTIMKTAGLILASTTMLMANGVVALETCKTDYITEDGKKLTGIGGCDKPIIMPNNVSSVTSLSNPNMLEDHFNDKKLKELLEDHFNDKKLKEHFNDKNTNAYYDFFTHKSSEVATSKSEAKIIENFIKEWVLAQEFHKYTYVISEEHSVIQKKHTSSPISVSKYRDNKSEVTTFTSEDGILEIKVTEKNTQREMDNVSYETTKDDVAKPENIELHLTASDISSNNKLQQIIEEPIIVSIFNPENMMGTIVFIESKKNTDGSVTMSLRVIGPNFFNKKSDGGDLTEAEFNLIKDMLGFNPVDRFSLTNGFNEISEAGFITITGMVMDKLDVKVGFNTSAIPSGSDIDFTKETIKRGEFDQKITHQLGGITIEPIDNTKKEEFNTSNNDVADNNKETTRNYDYRTDPTCNEPVKINQYVSEVVCDGYVIITKQQDVSIFDRIKSFIQQN